MSNQNPFKGNRGGGRIDTTKDFSKFLGDRKSKTFIVCLALLPYIAIGVMIYLLGEEVLAIFMLALPLALFLVFWLLLKAIDQ